MHSTNVILDIGNVICEWNPQKLVANTFPNEIEQQQALKHIIQHNDWLDLDKGILEIPQAIENSIQRCSLSPVKIEALIKSTPESLKPNSAMIDAIRKLAAKGIPLYVLSNMQQQAWEYLAETYDFWEYFEGIVVSYQINLIKPDRNIFKYITHRYRLVCADTIFFDDSIENIRAAEQFGIKSIHVTELDLAAKLLIDEVLSDTDQPKHFKDATNDNAISISDFSLL